MEPGRLAQREVRALGHQRLNPVARQHNVRTREPCTHRYVVIEEEEHPEGDAERERDADPLGVELPKGHEPRPPVRRLECAAHGERGGVRCIEPAPVSDRRRCDDGDGHAVVGEEAPHVAVEEGAVGEGAEDECGGEHDEGEDDGHVGTREGRGVDLARDCLNPVLQVHLTAWHRLGRIVRMFFLRRTQDTKKPNVSQEKSVTYLRRLHPAKLSVFAKGLSGSGIVYNSTQR